MNIRIECFEGERDAAVAAISGAFRVKSVSKAYPNVRQTGGTDIPTENRYYIKLEEQPFKAGSTLTDLMVSDMMRYLGMLSEAYGLVIDPELAKLRQFYLSSAGLTDAQKFELLSEWKAVLLARYTGSSGK